MKVLFVTPSENSAGEAITAINSAERVVAAGGEVHFLTSSFIHGFISNPVNFTLLTDSVAENQSSWQRLLVEFRPDAIVFADFAVAFFAAGQAPLGDSDWFRSLDGVEAELFTFDHLGYAQGPQTVAFGPPHLGIEVPIQQPPNRMHILLPCPVQEPRTVVGRRGVPFRYWSPPTLDERTKARVREKYAGDDLLVFHSVPTWASRWTAIFSHPYYDFLSDLLLIHLADLPRPVSVVSVNNGELLRPCHAKGIRIQNLSTLPKEDYETLILSSDLMLSENAISVSLGKAVCGGVPAVILKNGQLAEDVLKDAEPALARVVKAMEDKQPGAVYPYEVFPIWGRRQVESLGVFNESSYPDGVAAVEIFGAETKDVLRRLMLDQTARKSLVAKQKVYANRVAELPWVEEVIGDLIRH